MSEVTLLGTCITDFEEDIDIKADELQVSIRSHIVSQSTADKHSKGTQGNGAFL